MITADVLVVGAGVVGAATAYELARRGVDVAVVDAGADVGAGCSHANAGLLAPSHVEPLTTPANLRAGARYLFRRDSPFHVGPRVVPWLGHLLLASRPARARELTATMQRLARVSLAMHGAYSDAGLATGFRRSGSLDVSLDFDPARGGRHGRSPGWTRRGRIGHSPTGDHVLDAAAARALEPGLGDVAGAVWHADDATCDTRAFVRACLDAAVAQGARVHWNVRVSALRRRGDRITGADTDAGRVSAGAVVVAGGLDAGVLTAPLGVRLPLLAGKGYVVDVPVAPRPRIPVTFTELRVVATPYPDRLRLCGTMDLGDASGRIVASRVAAIRRAAARGLPGVDTSRPLQVWVGRRPCTADGIPVIGRSSRVAGLHVAAGHGMWGLVLAPVTGEAVAREVVGEEPRPDLAPFSPDRFVRRGSPTASTVRARCAAG